MEILNFVIGVAALIVAVVALVIAVPPFVQVVYGGPRIRLAFNESSVQGSRLLICDIHNVPVKSWFLRKIGVTRTSTEVFASFDIREHGTKKIIANSFRASLRDGRDPNSVGLTRIARVGPPIVFVIVQQDHRQAVAINHAPMQCSTTILPTGEYFVDVKLALGEEVKAIAKSFTIDANKDVTHWTARRIEEQW